MPSDSLQKIQQSEEEIEKALKEEREKWAQKIEAYKKEKEKKIKDLEEQTREKLDNIEEVYAEKLSDLKKRAEQEKERRISKIEKNYEESQKEASEFVFKDILNL